MSKDIEVTTHHFKTHFSELVRAMESGLYDRVVVKRNKKQVAIVSLPEPDVPPQRRLGILEGQFHMTEEDWKAWNDLDKEIERDIYESIDKKFNDFLPRKK